jgi:hypothetical protein
MLRNRENLRSIGIVHDFKKEKEKEKEKKKKKK